MKLNFGQNEKYHIYGIDLGKWPLYLSKTFHRILLYLFTAG
ncbi:hypothetical protein C7460_11220 [Marinoscillum furvescens DSM 4134]|uniref:Uncharacterized protein n=1 Tax=Marinoscillum furvescens DSM 4134 TaxID=1122208 RepID=A0A3D9L350_MARFU|nr:hypothetical protein C7460_11220 [Marinoscillum furvescens DSM 4134]